MNARRLSRRSSHSSYLNEQTQNEIEVLSERCLNPSKNGKRRSERLHAQSNEAGKCYGSGKIPRPATDANVRCMNLQGTISGISNQSRPLVMKRTGSDEIKRFDRAAIRPRAKKKPSSYVQSFAKNADIDVYTCKKIQIPWHCNFQTY